MLLQSYDTIDIIAVAITNIKYSVGIFHWFTGTFSEFYKLS